MSFTVRKGERSDLPRVLQLIAELAKFEKASDQVSLTVDMMESDGFGKIPVFGFFVAENDAGSVASPPYPDCENPCTLSLIGMGRGESAQGIMGK